VKWIAAFGRFWYVVIVGASGALAIGGVAAVVLTALLVATAGGSPAAILLPLLVAITLAVSLRWPR
jgi:hypothetical protein